MANPSYVSGSNVTNGTTKTISTAAVSNGLLLVEWSGQTPPTSMDYDGIAMTDLGVSIHSGEGKVWYCFTSSEKTSKVITATGGNGNCFLGSLYFQDCKQQAPTHTGVKAQAGAGTFTQDITTDVDNSLVVWFMLTDGGTCTAGAGMTRRWADTTVRGGAAFTSTSVVSPAALFTAATAGSDSGFYSAIMSLEPVPPAAPTGSGLF